MESSSDSQNQKKEFDQILGCKKLCLETHADLGCFLEKLLK